MFILDPTLALDDHEAVDDLGDPFDSTRPGTPTCSSDSKRLVLCEITVIVWWR